MIVKVEHPNGYMGILYGKSSMTIYDKDGHECLHTGFRAPNTEEELYEVLEDMPRTMEIIEQTESTGSPIGDYRDGVGAWQKERGE